MSPTLKPILSRLGLASPAAFSLAFSLAAMTWPLVARSEDTLDYSPGSGWYERPANIVPTAFVDRPLTLPHRHFGIDFSLDFTRLDKRVPLWVLKGAGGYGISNDLELGIELIEWSFSPDPRSGLGAPTPWVSYRLISGIFEAAAVLEADLPIAGINVEGRLPVAVRVGSVLRLDAAPAVRLSVGSIVVPTLTLPLSASFQLGQRFRMFAGASGIYDDFAPSRLSVEVFGGVALAFEDKRGAYCDARLEVVSPRIEMVGTLAEPPTLGFDATALFNLVFYIFDPPDVGRFGEGL
ncbi:MAG: hypothetical protein HY791_24435 [Deltaproteobacteria bacterium]|nr:hypothetical protein [Deltaproteobacteria bacterium]